MKNSRDKNKLTEEEIEVLLQKEDFSDITLDDELEEEQDTSFDRETYDYDFNVEADYNAKEVIMPARQLNDCISFDSI